MTAQIFDWLILKSSDKLKQNKEQNDKSNATSGGPLNIKLAPSSSTPN